MIAKEKELGGGGVAPADVPAQAAPAIDASAEEETKCGTHLLKAE